MRMASMPLIHQRNRPNGIDSLGRIVQSSLSAELPAHLHGLAFSYVGKKGDLASAVDLQGELALMFRTQARRSLGKNLSQTIHEMLQLFGSLIVEREFLLTNSAFSLSTMEHDLKRDLLRCTGFRL